MQEMASFEQFFTGSWQESAQALQKLVNFDFVNHSNKERIADIKLLASNLLSYPEAVLDDIWQEENQEFLLLLDTNLVNKALSLTPNEDTEKVVQQLHEHLQLLCAATGGLPGLAIYTPQELSNIFSQKMVDYDKHSFLYTCLQISLGLDHEEYIDVIMPFMTLEVVLARRDFNTEDTLMYAVLIKALWFNFLLLSDDDRYELLKNYFYKAIVIGAPVQKILQNYLDVNSYNQYIYLKKYIDLIKALKKNTENILVFQDNKTSTKPLLSMINDYVVSVGEVKILDGLAQKEFLSSFYGSIKGWGKYVKWLTEVFYIFFHIERANLLEKPAFNEKNKISQSEEDLLDLLYIILMGNDWSKLISYYKQANPLLPLQVVLRYCSKDFILDDEDVLDKFLDLTQALKDADIIDKDIIEFHESDGKFHWNEELIY